MNNLVSIVTPTLNQGELIEQTLLSVRGQDYPNVEHIVMDGGSRDGTLDLLRKFEGSYDLKWASGPDRGMYDAINRGMYMAKGDILAYLNSDDFYFPWTVSLIVEQFKKYPTMDLLFGDQVVQLLEGRTILQFQPPPRMSLLRRTGWSLPQATVFWRRRVYEELGGFQSSLQYCGDWDFWVRAAQKFHLAHMKEFLAVVRVHAEAKTTARAPELNTELQNLLRQYSAGWELGAVPRFYEKAYAWIWQRVRMAQFLAAHNENPAGSSAWSCFRAQGAKPESAFSTLVGFLPFGHRGTNKWAIEGRFAWNDNGLNLDQRHRFRS